jgi:hypothetical protein
MATSPNFGWAEPDNTDLVKNGALAIRTLGNAIDSSMVDLLGGTTGQVLSKTSNTNMDFTWVTTDDANAIQNAIVDAKGDLIAATANDTPARLAVGANDLVVTAASGEATGLKYTGGWTTYTPSLNGITQGNGTITARHRKLGKVVHLYFNFTLGSTSTIGTASYAAFGLPINNVVEIWGGGVVYTDPGVANVPGYYQMTTTEVYFKTSTGGNVTTTIPFTWATGDSVTLFGSYEVA